MAFQTTTKDTKYTKKSLQYFVYFVFFVVASDGWLHTSRAQRKPTLLPEVSGVLLVLADRR